jgi:hypothetical protein
MDVLLKFLTLFPLAPTETFLNVIEGIKAIWSYVQGIRWTCHSCDSLFRERLESVVNRGLRSVHLEEALFSPWDFHEMSEGFQARGSNNMTEGYRLRFGRCMVGRAKLVDH